MATTTSSLLKWLNIVAFVVMVIVNGLAGSTTIIGGKTTAQVSDANPTLITPAGYVFSIWGIIYTLLGIFVFYQALPNQKAKEFRAKVGYLFIASSILNIVWLFLWQFEHLVFSVFVMFLLLATLIAIYLRLDVGKSTVSLRDNIAFYVPFSVYLGWITIASIANVATALVSVNWDGFGINQETWAILVVVIALVITLLVIITRKDLAYGLVVIWAFAGIAVKQVANQTIVTIMEVSITILAIVLMIVVVASRVKH